MKCILKERLQGGAARLRIKIPALGHSATPPTESPANKEVHAYVAPNSCWHVVIGREEGSCEVVRPVVKPNPGLHQCQRFRRHRFKCMAGSQYYLSLRS